MEDEGADSSAADHPLALSKNREAGEGDHVEVDVASDFEAGEQSSEGDHSLRKNDREGVECLREISHSTAEGSAGQHQYSQNRDEGGFSERV